MAGPKGEGFFRWTIRSIIYITPADEVDCIIGTGAGTGKGDVPRPRSPSCPVIPPEVVQKTAVMAPDPAAPGGCDVRHGPPKGICL